LNTIHQVLLLISKTTWLYDQFTSLIDAAAFLEYIRKQSWTAYSFIFTVSDRGCTKGTVQHRQDTRVRVKIAQLVNKICLFPVVDKSGHKLLSSCNKVDEANRLATSCSNKSDIICT
jgi:hypothetical protein